MSTGHVFIATSLDGFIALEDGTIDWSLQRDDPGEDHGYDDFIKDIDAIVMGRGSFQMLRDHRPWPYNLPVLVLSKTLSGQDIPSDLEDKVRVSGNSPQQAMAMLEAEGCGRVYVDGGLIIRKRWFSPTFRISV
ncbi:dihydrofolate reductase family protein [Mycoplana dimorpha]|uniref:RibD domain-containing protein n=1 Tax=Mycoplana dimorpha TaxID=28320 RepID=A0A2T5AXG9_MYCDI|nr:dihydrofolate reductase family protein [Mycoplana dimorpha]PTM91397.1 RibD domain-containing protein [Mycoplana dimorpha]